MGTKTPRKESVVQLVTEVKRDTKERHKSPSKAARDWLRAKLYWGRSRATALKSVVREAETQTEGLVNSESVVRNGVWRRVQAVFEKKRKDAIDETECFGLDGRKRPESGGPVPKPLQLGPDRGRECEIDVRGGMDPRCIYEMTEDKMRLSRLEEEKNLIRALRHLVRNVHEGGKSVLFQYRKRRIGSILDAAIYQQTQVSCSLWL